MIQQGSQARLHAVRVNLWWFILAGSALAAAHAVGAAAEESLVPPSFQAVENQPGLEARSFVQTTEFGATETLFEAIPAERSGVSFQLQLPDVEKHIHEIIHLSVYGGLCTGDYDGDGLADIYVTSPAGGSRLFRNRGDFRFEDVTEQTGLTDANVWGTGATFVDIDNDGDLDIYACGYKSPNRLFINRGTGPGEPARFVDQAKRYGLDYRGASMTMAFADIDNDGDLDGYLATTALPPPPNLKFRVAYEGKKPVIPKELQEYWAMVYLPGDRALRTEAGQFDHLFRNDGDRFTEISESAGIDGAYFTLSAIWWDYNRDGHPDLYVANDYLGPDMLYKNNGNGTFTNVIRQSVPHTPWSSMGTDIGDINNDGLMDLLATDMLGSTHYRRQVMAGETSKTGWFLEVAEPRQYVRNALYLNTGSGRMMETAYQAGLAATDWTWGPRMEDFDNDGRVDVFIPNGMLRDVQHADLGAYADRVLGAGSQKWARFWAEQPMQTETNLAFRNAANLRFERSETQWGLDRKGVSLGAATADFDNDGRLDLVVNNADAPVSIYRNRAKNSASIRVHLKGTTSNAFGIGATVIVKTGSSTQTKYLTLSRGWLSSSEPVLHFGIGRAKKIDSLTVDWPSGRRQSFSNLEGNRSYRIAEPAESASPRSRQAGPSATLFAESKMLDGIQSPRIPYDDFAREPLLPKKLSQRGFCMAWADVDGDGDQDLFLGGGVEHEGRLYIHEKDDQWIPSPQPSLQADRVAEDAAAAFFDFDSDGDPDLFVASGGVRAAPGHPSYRDRLYLNDGKGKFAAAPENTIPDLRDSASCVAVSDFDRDGKPEVFIGAFSIPGRYPLAGTSRLLANKGGTLLDETPAALRDAGLVTDALWSDCDGDGWMDLVLATEWGPLRFFRNANGTLVDRTNEAGLSLLTGWWNAIAAGDLDGDGDTDLVGGNLGSNTAYQAEPGKPELLFYGDFDGSGTPNLLEAYFVGDYGFPRRGLDALSKVMPMLRDKFPTFDPFARAPIENLFSMDRLRKSRRREAATFESGVFLNDGSGRFQFFPLPPLAQIGPARDLELVDINADGKLDLVLAQNDFSQQPQTGRMDGGVGLLLLGNGKGQFNPVWPNKSGILVKTEGKRLSVLDLNRDGRSDLVFGISSGTFQVFLRTEKDP